jgi:hypothetical protein
MTEHDPSLQSIKFYQPQFHTHTQNSTSRGNEVNNKSCVIKIEAKLAATLCGNELLKNT